MILYSTIRSIYRYFYPIINKGNDNILLIKSKIKSNFFISIYGNNNRIEIDCNCSLENTSISIIGDNNSIYIGSNIRFIGPCSIIMEGNSTLKIGDKTGIRGASIIIKDGFVEIGEDCMTSYGVLIRNHDSHKIYKIEDLSNQINNPKDIKIGNHVWLCQNTTILKNVIIGDNSVVGYGAIVTKGCPPNSIIAGNPSTVVKQGIIWSK